MLLPSVQRTIVCGLPEISLMLAKSKFTDFWAEVPTPASELSLACPSWLSVTTAIGTCQPDSFIPAPLATGPYSISAIWS
eukprot:3180752-Pyramimonas_sp.AAC.1